MPHPTNTTQYVEGLQQQQDALRELRDHAHRLMGGLPWITDDVADMVATLEGLARRGH